MIQSHTTHSKKVIFSSLNSLVDTILRGIDFIQPSTSNILNWSHLASCDMFTMDNLTTFLIQVFVFHRQIRSVMQFFVYFLTWPLVRSRGNWKELWKHSGRKKAEQPKGNDQFVFLTRPSFHNTSFAHK